ncbi:MAG: hypothetical protein R3C49_13585 [Planctomycetaceae bacterium]
MTTSGLQNFVKRFLKHRMAVLAFLVILLYAVLATLLLAGMIVSRDDVTRRYGPMHVPGFGRTASAEKRLLNIEWWIRGVEICLKKSDPTKALESFEPVGSYIPADRPITELQADVDRLYMRLDQLDQSLEQRGDTTESLPESMSADIASLEADVLTLYQPLTETPSRRGSPLRSAGDRPSGAIDFTGHSIRFRLQCWSAWSRPRLPC